VLTACAAVLFLAALSQLAIPGVRKMTRTPAAPAPAAPHPAEAAETAG
jgi:hypothetical protein